VFGKLNWQVTDEAFHIQPGLRVNYDKKVGSYMSASNGRRRSGNLVPAAADARSGAQRDAHPPQLVAPKPSALELSGDLTLSYKLHARRHGLCDLRQELQIGRHQPQRRAAGERRRPISATQTVKPEKVNHFEIGLKTQFWDRKATLNLAGFWTEIEDYQANVNNGQIGPLRGYLANAGKVRVRGVEARFLVPPERAVQRSTSTAPTPTPNMSTSRMRRARPSFRAARHAVR
jgi:iron complex outermembrane receptor protein